MEINKIYNENCLETMAKMPDCFIDLTVTSPPCDNIRNYNGYSFEFEKIAKELFRVIKQGGVVVWVVNDATIDGSESGTSFRQALYFKDIGFNLHDTMIYKKKNPVPYNHNRYNPSFEFMFILSKGKPKTFNAIREDRLTDVVSKTRTFRYPNGDLKQANKKEDTTDKLRDNVFEYVVGSTETDQTEHPATFPEKLPKEMIYSWSNENDLVYDCFTGSGTTLKMAHLQKRNWIGSEISAEYCKIAEKRIEPYLMQTFLF